MRWLHPWFQMKSRTLMLTQKWHVHDRQIQCNDDSVCCVIYRSIVNILSHMYDPHHKRWTYHSLCGTMLDYVSMSEKTNIKLVELVGVYSIMYGSKHPDYTWKDKIGLMYENTEKWLNKSGKTLFHISMYL
jgi:hypothetical protein